MSPSLRLGSRYIVPIPDADEPAGGVFYIKRSAFKEPLFYDSALRNQAAHKRAVSTWDKSPNRTVATLAEAASVWQRNFPAQWFITGNSSTVAKPKRQNTAKP